MSNFPKESAARPKIKLESKRRVETHPSSNSHGVLPKMTSTTTTVSKKRKRPSPFRVKKGCVVALRMQPEGNHVDWVLTTSTQPDNLERNETTTTRTTKVQLLPAPLSTDTNPATSITATTTTSETHVQPTSLKTPLILIWTAPVAGRDEGLNLVGKRIRCFFPKTFKGQNLQKKVLEGEVVHVDESFSACLDQERAQSEPGNGQPSGSHSGGQDFDGETRGFQQTLEESFLAEVLVDRNHYFEYFAFLPRTDHDLENGKAASLDDVTLKYHRLEEKIRGKNKVVIKLFLMKPGYHGVATGDGPSRWVIQKRVPAKLFHDAQTVRRSGANEAEPTEVANTLASDNRENGKSAANHTDERVNGETSSKQSSEGKSKRTKSLGESANSPVKKRPKTAALSSPLAVGTNRHIGDGNDAPEQQVLNWRWMASRYEDWRLSGGHRAEEDPWSPEFLACHGLVGQVVDMKPMPAKSSTLAMVTIRRLFLPEQTADGRLPWRKNGIFDDWYCKGQELTTGTKWALEVPVEQLIVISRQLQLTEKTDVTSGSKYEGLVLAEGYSFRDNIYGHISDGDAWKKEGRECCHRCRSIKAKGALINGQELGGTAEPYFCSWCWKALIKRCDSAGGIPVPSTLLAVCDCRSCARTICDDRHQRLVHALYDAKHTAQAENISDSPFAGTLAVLRVLPEVEFGLPSDFIKIESIPVPSNKPSAPIKSKGKKRPTKRFLVAPTSGRKNGKNGVLDTNKKVVNKENQDPSQDMEEDYTVFRSTCARLTAYGSGRTHQKHISPTSSSTAAVPVRADRPRNLRDERAEAAKIESVFIEEKAASVSSGSRAARANQRRLMKDMAAFGASRLVGLDKLSTREPLLRFDRSGIHAWGVFADEEILAGEMVMEYRGELIGNAVAELREKEYEAAKIGSDYMFRIDQYLVCDATKQGNMARFINASCDPNCVTKIITVDGCKRIVIYAKRDIRVGEELCYDYKFPLEYDESKRIPCHCSSRECRGFMNWDKRFVALPSRVRQALQHNLSSTLLFWTGIVLIISIFFAIGALLANITAWSIFSVVSKENAPVIFRSSVGVFAAQLPNVLVRTSIYLFFAWQVMFWWLLMSWIAAAVLTIAACLLLILIATTYSAMGRIIMATSAMSHQPILPRDVEEGKIPLELSWALLDATREAQATAIPVDRQYRFRIVPVLKTVPSDDTSMDGPPLASHHTGLGPDTSGPIMVLPPRVETLRANLQTVSCSSLNGYT